MSTAYHLKNKSVTKLPTCSRSYRYVFFCLKIDKITNHFHENGRHWNWFDSGASLPKILVQKMFFWKQYSILFCTLVHDGATGYIKVDINLIYISILKALSQSSRFVLSHFWKSICLDKTKHAKLYCKQKLKKSIILHLQNCNILTQFLKTKLPKKNYISLLQVGHEIKQ